MVNQIAVFLENKEGRMRRFLSVLKNAGINLLMVTVAESADYGILRAITDNNAAAEEVLRAAGYTTKRSDILAVEIASTPGKLLEVVSLFEGTDINIEYFYSYTTDRNTAVVVLKVNDNKKAVETLKANGVTLWE